MIQSMLILRQDLTRMHHPFSRADASVCPDKVGPTGRIAHTRECERCGLKARDTVGENFYPAESRHITEPGGAHSNSSSRSMVDAPGMAFAPHKLAARAEH
jgi:hypothetical protein